MSHDEILQRTAAVASLLSRCEITDKTELRKSLPPTDAVSKLAEVMPRTMVKRNLTGAPGTKEVAKQLARWREQLS
jgi:hypothetical protein